MSVRNTVKSIQDIMRQDAGVDGDAQRISQLCWMFFLKIIDDQDQALELLRDDYQSPIPERFQWRTWAANPEGITGDELLTFINIELFAHLKQLPATGPAGDRRRVVRGVFEDAYNYMKSGHLMRQVLNKISGVDFNNLAERQHFGDIYEQILNDLQSAGNAGEYYTPRAVTAFMVDRIDPKPGEILLDPACGTGGFLTCALRHMRDRYVKRPEDEQTMQAALRAVEKKQLPHMLCVTNMLLHDVEDASFVRHDNTLARSYISYEQADRVDIVLTNPPFGGREESGIESNFPKQFQTRETADLFLALIIRLLKPDGRAAVVLPDGSLFGEGVKTRLKEQLMEECDLHANALPCSLAWEAFGESNGALSAQQMRTRIGRYRKVDASDRNDFSIGCRILTQPFFFAERDWIPVPPDWSPNIVSFKTYNTATAEGSALWESVSDRLGRRSVPGMADAGPRFGEPHLIRPRLGQGAFRVLVTDIYQRRCAVTQERTLPALEAAHIRPYGDGGEHETRNGLLLRRDIHSLFDAGYVTVTPDLRFEVSKRIREEFENGRHYYALQGQAISAPVDIGHRPDPDALTWHNEQCFKG